jgi:hypothetical protein
LLAAGGPEEVKAIRQLLHEQGRDSAEWFWPVLQNAGEPRPRRLRAACALALSVADDPRWARVSDDVVRCLAGENLLVLRDWAELLGPVRAHLLPHQVRRLVEADTASFPAFLAMLQTEPEDAAVAPHAQLEHTASPTPSLDDKLTLARQLAQAAVALLHLGRPERVWPLFHQGADPMCRTYFIHRCATLGVDPAILARRLLADEEKDPSSRQGLLLALGEYGADQRADVVRGPLVERLRQDYRADPDPGVHSAVEWLLRRWGQGLVKVNPGPARGDVTKPRWYVNGQGQTFAVIPAPGSFEIGSPSDERGRFPVEDRRQVRIDYPFTGPAVRACHARPRPGHGTPPAARSRRLQPARAVMSLECILCPFRAPERRPHASMTTPGASCQHRSRVTQHRSSPRAFVARHPATHSPPASNRLRRIPASVARVLHALQGVWGWVQATNRKPARRKDASPSIHPAGFSLFSQNPP